MILKGCVAHVQSSNLPKNPPRHWRIYVTAIIGGATANYPAAAEIELKTNELSPNLAVGGVPKASSVYEGLIKYNAAKAFDRDAATYWNARDWPLPQWISYELPSPAYVGCVKITSRPDGVGTTPFKSFIIQSSYDGLVWRNEWSVLDEPAWGLGETRTFSKYSPKPDMDISQLSGVVLYGEQPKPNMEISQLDGVVLSGGGTTTMDISQLGGVVLHETEF